MDNFDIIVGSLFFVFTLVAYVQIVVSMVKQWARDEESYRVKSFLFGDMHFCDFEDGDTWAFLIGYPILSLCVSMLFGLLWPVFVPLFFIIVVPITIAKMYKTHYKASQLEDK